MEKTKPTVSKYIAAFSLTTLVFIVGIFLGNYIAQSGLTDLKESQEILRTQLLGLDLRDRLITSQNVCEISVKEITELFLKENNLTTKIKYSGGKNGSKGDVPIMKLDISKIKKLGWKPNKTSHDCIIETISKIQKNKKS